MKTFPKKNKFSYPTKPGRRVEIHLKTVSLGKLVVWYFVKSLICLPLESRKKVQLRYRTSNFSDLNLIFVYLPMAYSGNGQ